MVFHLWGEFKLKYYDVDLMVWLCTDFKDGAVMDPLPIFSLSLSLVLMDILMKSWLYEGVRIE